MKENVQKISICFIIVASIFVFSGCICKPDEEVQITLMSSKIGYSVKGPYGFTGTITKENVNAEEWVVSGTFLFPNKLYFYLGKRVKIEEIYPEQIKIHFYVLPSRIGEILSPETKERKVEFKIKASNDARFEVNFN
ncbi:MAG: hypothetical protein LDL53_04030 [Candidatus Hydrogenedens sp.]|nr:hypothetical protein [Candidatus Hydrogenedens sp.]